MNDRIFRRFIQGKKHIRRKFVFIQMVIARGILEIFRELWSIAARDGAWVEKGVLLPSIKKDEWDDGSDVTGENDAGTLKD